MAGFHTYAMCVNKTTREFLKNFWEKPAFNPFDRNWKENVKSFMIRKPK